MVMWKGWIRVSLSLSRSRFLYLSPGGSLGEAAVATPELGLISLWQLYGGYNLVTQSISRANGSTAAPPTPDCHKSCF